MHAWYSRHPMHAWYSRHPIHAWYSRHPVVWLLVSILNDLICAAARLLACCTRSGGVDMHSMASQLCVSGAHRVPLPPLPLRTVPATASHHATPPTHTHTHRVFRLCCPSRWCLMKSPLIIGADVRAIPAASMAILNNRALIAVNQDDLGIQGTLRTATASPSAEVQTTAYP